MSVRRINYASRSSFEEAYGYSRAVRVGDTVYVAGCTGYDYASGTISPDPIAQFDQVIANIEAALGQAGARLAEVVQLTLYVTGADVMEAIQPRLAETFGPIRPTNTALVVAFPVPDVKLEITVNAVIGCADD